MSGRSLRLCPGSYKDFRIAGPPPAVGVWAAMLHTFNNRDVSQQVESVILAVPRAAGRGVMRVGAGASGLIARAGAGLRTPTSRSAAAAKTASH
eukprot:COSAG01_NODE_42123_length_443_cov_1.212209_1_plen_94_part_00